MVNMESEVTKLISAFQLSLAEIEIKKQVNIQRKVILKIKWKKLNQKLLHSSQLIG